MRSPNAHETRGAVSLLQRLIIEHPVSIVPPVRFIADYVCAHRQALHPLQLSLPITRAASVVGDLRRAAVNVVVPIDIKRLPSMEPPDLLIIPPVRVPPCFPLVPSLPATVGSLLLEIHQRVPMPKPRTVPFPDQFQSEMALRGRMMQLEMKYALHKFVHGYHQLQALRLGALAALVPDSQMCIDWLEMEFHMRLEVTSYVALLARATYTRSLADVHLGWKFYTQSFPSLHSLGFQMCPKERAVLLSIGPDGNQQLRIAEPDVLDELLMSPSRSDTQA